MSDEASPGSEALELDYLVRSCRTCGRPMSLPKDSQQVYCSPECSQEYLRCPVCGKFFLQAEGAAVCSPECAEKHPEFDYLFKEFT